VKESEIESGVAGCVKQLISAVSCVEILLGEFTIDLHRSGGFPKIPQREGTGEEAASVVTGISQHVGPPAVSTGDVDNDPGHVQKVQFNEPLSPRPVKHGTREIQSVDVNEIPLVKRLDGEVMRQGEIPFAGGMYYEVWVGQWKKGAGEGGGEKVEKVSLSITTPTLLT